MAAFVDCTKYTKEQNAQDKALENLAKKNEEQDKDIKALEDREIVHDNTLTGGGIDTKSPLSVAVSTKEGNAVKTGKDAGGNGVFVKDLQPEVDALEKALTDMNSRLSGDLTNSIKDLDNRLNNLKAIEVALAQAKADGNYQRIKDLEAQLAAAKQAEDLANKNLADAIDALRQQGLTDDQIRQIIADSIAKAGGTGRYVTGITVNQATGDVTYTYSDGTKVTDKLHEFQGVVVDNKTIGGNGTSEALHVKVSNTGGNQIQVFEDGLYIGKDNTHVLYVSNNGSDENIGTREKPMRTLQAAVERLAGKGGTAYINLHENHRFNWVDFANHDLNFVFKAYGDTIDAQYPDNFDMNAFYNGYVAKNYPRPIVDVRVHKKGNLVKRDEITGRNVTVNGIRFNIYNKFEGQDSNDYNGWFAGVFNANEIVQIHGSIISEESTAVPMQNAGAYRDDVIIRAPIVRWIDSLMPKVPCFISSNYTSQLSLVSWNATKLQGYGKYPDHESITKYETVMEDMSRGMVEKMTQVVIDRGGKRFYGILLNFDPFK